MQDNIKEIGRTDFFDSFKVLFFFLNYRTFSDVGEFHNSDNWNADE